MTKCENLEVTVEGRRPEILLDLTLIIAGLTEAGVSEEEILIASLAGINFDAVEKNPDKSLDTIARAVMGRK